MRVVKNRINNIVLGSFRSIETKYSNLIGNHTVNTYLCNQTNKIKHITTRNSIVIESIK